MSATLTLDPSPVAAIASFRRLPSRLPRDGWKVPVAIAVGLHVVLLVAGYFSSHDTLLDLIAKGETEAVAPVDPQPVQEVDLVDLTPPPPPELNPDFVTPQDTVKEPTPPAPKPRPQVNAPPAPKQIQFAASNVVIGDKNFPKPPYPYEAKVKRFQGTVVISLSIVDGNIVSEDVTNSSGYGILDEAATNFIRQAWHFPPSMTRNFSLPVQFQLAGG